MRITFYGHAAFKVEVAGVKLLIDPWLSNPKAPEEVDRGPYDLILITHAHGDHLGDVLELAGDAEVVAIHEVQQYLLRNGVRNAVGMNIGGSYETKGVRITMVPAVHSSSFPDGTYGGDACGFVISARGERTLYHAGDTGLFSDMALIRELYSPDVVLLPIGDHYVMGPKEAAKACELLSPSLVVPMHFGTFPVLSGSPEAFEQELSSRGIEVQVRVLAPGESLEV